MEAAGKMRHSIARTAILVVFFATSGVNAAALERAVLELVVNGAPRGDVLVFLSDGDVWVPLESLRAAGLVRLDARTEPHAGIPHVSLRGASPPLSFVYDEIALTVSIVAPPWTLARTAIDLLPTAPANLRHAYDPSVFVNYAPRLIDGRHFSIFGETGLSLGAARAETSATWSPERGGTRLLSSATFDDRKHLRSATVGDALISAGPLGGSMLLGGLSIARNFGLDPYLVKIPRLGYTGSAIAPSTLDVYVNDILVRRVPVEPGQFDLTNVVPSAGAGVTRYVLRDAYGQEQRVESRYYASTSVLAKGLSEYAYGVGLSREDFGVRSFGYGEPAFIGRFRLGVSDHLTPGGHLEFNRSRANAGSELTLAGSFGEVELHSAASVTAEGPARRGVAGIVSYGYRKGGLSFNSLLRGATPDFSTLSLAPEQDRSLLEEVTTTSHALGSRASIGTEVSLADRRDAGLALRVALSQNTRLSRELSLQVRASRTKSEHARAADDLFVTLSWQLPAQHFAQFGGHFGTQGGDGTLRLSRSLQAETDVGYQASWSEGAVRRAVVSSQAQSPFGTAGATYTNVDGHQHTIIEASGSVVLLKKGVYFTRATHQSFALLEIEGAPGVRGYLNNRELGRTDENGRLFLPGLVPYQANRISIEQADLPLDYVLDADEVVLAPPIHGGAIVSFPARPVRFFRGSIVRRADGRSIPVKYGDLSVALPDAVLTSPLGAEGQFELEGLPSGSWLGRVASEGGACSVPLRVEPSKRVVQDLGVLTCSPAAAERPAP
jgi:outer membrane usher protein